MISIVRQGTTSSWLLRALALFAAAMMVVRAAPSAAGNFDPGPATMQFPAGGTVRMQLHAGNVQIVGAEADRITVSWRADPGTAQPDVRVDLRKDETSADVDVDGPSNHVRYRIEVPERSDVRIRMSAGNLEVERIAGSIDANLLAGNMELSLRDPGSYGEVHASVAAGGIDAGLWGVEKGGLMRSFDRSGPGSRSLRAAVKAGQLTIMAK